MPQNPHCTPLQARQVGATTPEIHWMFSGWVTQGLAALRNGVVGQMVGRALHKLTAKAVDGRRAHGRHSDGGGLYLVVDGHGRRWAFLYRWRGKRVEMGLGGYPAVALSVARAKAAAARECLAKGLNPREHRDAASNVPTFGDFADTYIEAMAPRYRNAKHIYQWRQTMGESYCRAIRSRLVSDISTADVLAVLTPIWQAKPETAGRVRGRIERVLDAAKVKGHRTGENPARWRGHLDHILPKRRKLSRGHYPAMPWQDVPAFMVRLQGVRGVAARALEFTILTVARSVEVRLMTKGEAGSDLWIVPASRMKAGVEHRVPLTRRAREVIDALAPLPGDLVFPGQKRGRPLSDMAMLKVLRTMGLGQYTVHGFRSSFRDWVGDATSFSGDLAEMALAHTVGNETERAYRRGDALERRRVLMEAWSSYCYGSVSVVRIVAKAG